MPSRPWADPRRAPLRHALPAAALLLAATAGAWADQAPAPAAPAAERAGVEPPGSPPSAAEIDAALKALRADPDLAGERTERTLRLKRGNPGQPRNTSDFDGWLRELIRWLDETGRVVVWIVGVIGITLLLWFVARAAAQRAGAGAARIELPSHVGALDIRPDSLPGDVGTAAWALWQRGETRAALSLLYRGALSRLVHGFGVPIKAASTEGECVALARRHASATAAELFAELVGVWQPAVYGARMPAASTVQRLCHAFGAVFTPPAAHGPQASAARVAP